MDSDILSGLFGFAFWIFIIIGMARTSNKAKDKKSTVQTPPRPQPAQAAQRQKPPAAAQQHKQMMPPAPKPAAQQAARRTPMQSTLKVTPHDHSDMFGGSMHAETTEGVDFCHPGEKPVMPSDISEHFFDEPETPAAPASLPAAANPLVQAFIMQEVLKRPSERRRRT